MPTEAATTLLLEAATTLLLDAVDTLFGLREPPAHTYAAFARRHGIAVETEAVTAAFGRCWGSIEPPRYGEAISEDPEARERVDRAWWRDLVRRCLIGAGAELRDSEASFDACFEALFLHYGTAEPWRVYTGTLDVLKRWRDEGRQRVVLSNFDRRLPAVMDALELTTAVDHILYSSVLGASKPDPRAFARALEIVGADPARTVHVGDDARTDGRGAATAGLRFLHLRRPA